MLRNNGVWDMIKIMCNHDKKGKWVYCTPDSFFVWYGGLKNDEVFKNIWREWTASGDCWQQTGEHGFYSVKSALTVVNILREKYPQHEFKIVLLHIDQHEIK
jgi:hypothetical protein